MPQVAIAAALASAAGAAGAYAAGIAITAKLLIINAAIGAATALVGQALAPKAPKTFDTSQLGGRTQTIRQPIVSRKLVYGRARVSGPLVYVQGTNNNSYLHLIIPVAAHQISAINTLYLDGIESTNPRFDGYVRIEKFLGSDDQAASANLIAESNGQWTAAHRLRGTAYIYLRLYYLNPDVWPSGIPSVSVDVEGANTVYDPRDGSTGYIRNPALLIRHYLKDAKYGLGCSDAEVDDDYFEAAANTCDETVTKADGTTEARYTCDGVIDTANSPQSILQELLTSCGGRLVWSGGKWRLYVAAYDAPTLTFDEGDLAAPISVQTRVSQREAFTAIKGVYVSPENNWQPSDYPAIKSAAALADLGLSSHKYRDHPLPFTVSPSMAQRLAKIELLKQRQPITVGATFNLKGLQFQAGDTIALTNTRFGWSAKAFEVVEWSLAIEQDRGGNPTLVVKTLLRETAASIYDWSTSEETEVDDAPNSNLPDPFSVLAPGAPVVAEEQYQTNTGRGVATKALISWSASLDAFVEQYQPEYRAVGATDWITLARTNLLTAEVPDIAAGTYDFRVKALNGLGVSSAYATTRTEIYGLSAAPSTPTALNIQKFGGQAFITLALHPDLDVRIGGRLLVRHSEATSAAEWSESFSIGNPEGYPGSSVNLVLPLKSGSYLIRAEDSSGSQSASWAELSTDGADIREFADVDLIQEDDDFLGDKSGVVLDGTVLKLAGVGLVDDIPDFDSIASLDDYGGVGSSGTYDFAAGLDLVTKRRVRLTSILEGIVSNVNDLIDDRTDPIDSWLDFDGNDGGSACDCYIEVRATDDEPGGSPSPTWGPWNRLDAAEFNARGFEFRAQLTSSDPAYNILVSQMRVRAEELV